MFSFYVPLRQSKVILDVEDIPLATKKILPGRFGTSADFGS